MMNGELKLGSANIGVVDIFSLRLLKAAVWLGVHKNESFFSKSWRGQHMMP
jgi:hypothetical protein